MKHIDTIQFVDIDSKDNALVIIRASSNEVGLALSLRKNGDILVVFQKDVCEQVINALQQAIATDTE